MPFIVPRPSKCPECLGGRVGLNMCETCEGTGTIFKVGSKRFPDTRDGYAKAEQELEHQRIADFYRAGGTLGFDCGGLGCGTQPCCCA